MKKKKPAKDRRTIVVKVLVNKDEEALLDARANAHGTSRSNYLRMAGLYADRFSTAV